jgi:hypothetical protein
MRRLVAILLVAVLFVATLAYWSPVLGFFENLYNRPYQNLTDQQLRAEIATAEGMVTILAEQSLGLAARPADPGATLDTRESWAEVNQASVRLRQLRAKLAYRVERVRYFLIGGFGAAFLVFFLFFRDAYRAVMPGARDRERGRAQMVAVPKAVPREAAPASAPAAEPAERLGGIDSRLSRLRIGRSSEQQVTKALGLPAHTVQDGSEQTLTYYFDAAEKVPGGVPVQPRRVAVLVVMRAGILTDIRVETAEVSKSIARTL